VFFYIAIGMMLHRDKALTFAVYLEIHIVWMLEEQVFSVELFGRGKGLLGVCVDDDCSVVCRHVVNADIYRPPT